MKKYILISIVALSALVACTKEHATNQKITYYPVLTLEGGAVVLNIGSAYTEPGYSAFLGGQDVTSEVQVSNNIDNSKTGAYSVSYMAVNEDGFSASASRDVFVVGSGFENFYLSEVQNPNYHYYDAPITITHLEGNYYQISDILGGFYFHGRYPGYEPSFDFHAESIIELNPDNTITLIEEGDWYFYDPDDPLTIQVGTFDPDNKSVHLEVGFSGSTSFIIDLVSPSAN